MKKFAILAIVFAFAGVMLAGCPGANNAAKTNGTTGGSNTSNAANG